MNKNRVKIGLVILLILGLLIATGWFGYNYDTASKGAKKLQKKIDAIELAYHLDSIKYTKQLDSLAILTKKQDSIIKAKLQGIKWIQDKYNIERSKIRALDADSTLKFFKIQSEISNDW